MRLPTKLPTIDSERRPGFPAVLLNSKRAKHSYDVESMAEEFRPQGVRTTHRTEANGYASPSPSRVVACLENRLLSADDSWWSGRNPLHARVVAEVPRALYLNFLASKSYASALAPHPFRPLDLPGDNGATLFTILVFALERARPQWAPRMLSTLAPRILQSNWRFYGHLTETKSEARRAVLFIRTVTTSLAMSVFGRRLARCFPLRRAHHMTLQRADRHVTALIDPGGGSAPELMFEGEQAESSEVGEVFRKQFSSYEDYSRWIIDQHLSLVVWPNEYVVQDMHLDFQQAKITPLRCLKCRISGLEDFIPGEIQPFDCFVVEGLRVFLDNIYAVRDSARR